MNWLDKLSQFWPHLAAGFDFLAALFASIHALLHKRDSRAATLWLGIIWFLPLLGPILYLSLGVNRIRRRAISLRLTNPASKTIPENFPEAPQLEGRTSANARVRRQARRQPSAHHRKQNRAARQRR